MGVLNEPCTEEAQIESKHVFCAAAQQRMAATCPPSASSHRVSVSSFPCICVAMCGTGATGGSGEGGSEGGGGEGQRCTMLSSVCSKASLLQSLHEPVQEPVQLP